MKALFYLANQELYQGAGAGDTAVMKSALVWGADVNCVTSNGTPLTAAIGKGSKPAVQMLLEHGADIDVANQNGWTALTYAAQMGKEDFCEFLLQQGANIEHTNYQGSTPLLSATCGGKDGCVHLLLEHGADVHARDKRGNNALFYALQYKGSNNANYNAIEKHLREWIQKDMDNMKVDKDCLTQEAEMIRAGKEEVVLMQKAKFEGRDPLEDDIRPKFGDTKEKQFKRQLNPEIQEKGKDEERVY